MADVETADDLYGLEPEGFIAARGALAKRLRAAGEREEAGRVAKLRRPPATAWALNVVARTEPQLLEAVLEEGGDLRAAMERAVAGDASGLRAAQAGERRAVDAATAAAARVLGGGGHAAGDAARQRVAGTLRAAMVDEEVADRLRRGVLDADHSAPGFGLDALGEVEPGSAPPPKRKERRPLPGDGGEEEDDAAAARERRAAAARELELLEKRAEKLRRDAERAERRAGDLRTAADEATAESERQARRAQRLHGEAEQEKAVADRLRADADAAAERAAEARRTAG